MKNGLGLQFRGLAQEIVPILPPDMIFLGGNLEDARANTTRTYVVVDEAQTSRIISWGRQHRNGKSILRVVRIYDIYDRSDLDGLKTVEVFPPHNEDYSSVVNAKKALDAVWTCEYCDRVATTQVVDLHVKIQKKLDLQSTTNGEWIVSVRAQEALQEFGFTYRPLKNSSQFAQLLIAETAVLRTAIPPIHLAGDVCPGCGLRSMGRNDYVEGNLLDWSYPNITICREFPVTIGLSAQNITFAQSDVRRHVADISPTPTHKVGEKVNYANFAPIKYFTMPLFFASAKFMKHVLDSGITGLAFRPVHFADL